MKIMIISDQYPPYQFGGMAQHTFHISRQLADLNNQILLLLPKHFQINTYSPNLEIRSVLHSSYYVSSFRAGICKKEFRPDLIHIVTAGMLYPSLSGYCPVIQRVVGNDFLRPWKGKGFLFRGIVRFVPTIKPFISSIDSKIRKETVLRELEKADLILSNSDWTTSKLIEKGIDKIKIKSFVGGVDTKIFSPNKDFSGLKEKHGLNEESRVLITAGNLIQKKGFDTVLKALPAVILKHPNLLYFIVGDGPEKEALEQMVDKLKINSNVCFLGALSQEKFAMYLSMSTVYVQVSRNHQMQDNNVDVETMGRTFFEAGSCSIPVIASNIGGIPSVVQHDINGLLLDNPEDSQDLSKKINILLSDKNKRVKMGKNGRDIAIKRFSWDILADLFLSEATRF